MSRKPLLLCLLLGVIGIAAWAVAAHRAPGPTTLPAAQPTGPIRVMTSNIRFSDPGDGANAWPNRRDLLVKTYLKHDPDIIGCQEVTPAQGAFLIKELANWYTHYPRPGVGKVLGATTGGVSGELMGVLSVSAAGLNTLFYRTSRFEQLDGEAGLVLPDAPQANPSENTFYTLAVLRDKSMGAGKLPDLVVIDTHLRHNGDFAVKCATRLHEIAARVQGKYAGSAVIVMGDINHDRTAPVHGALLGAEGGAAGRWSDAFDYGAHGTSDAWGTFHNFTGRSDRPWPTDLIFVSGGLQASGAEIVRDAEGGRYPSDHFPVMAEVRAGGGVGSAGNGGGK